MSVEKQVGKIRSVRLGSGGYQDAMFGFTFELSGENWGCGDFWGVWMEKSSSPHPDVIETQGQVFQRVKLLMIDAKVSDFSKLLNIPVEVTFENQALKSWRVLKEVL